ncbi:MAG: peptidyl-prolyl cis-trans isomerase [Gammaproteobacteria bacterium]|nr:peptidyl-prolyl cis-trans isomerase [Gammaproteobacteria bacterium]
MQTSGAEPTQVKIETTAGDFVVQLDAARAPLTVANFLQYVTDGFYAGTIFHRVVNGFVIQGGGFTPELAQKPHRPPVVNESGNGLSNRRGSVAMARTGEPHSADSQFYVNLADNVPLDAKPTRWGYAVFGEVVQGMDVVDEIGHRVTGSKGGMQDVPVEAVVIRKISVLKIPVPK